MEISRIEYVSPLGEADPLNDNIDVHVYFADGRIYSFVVATPNNIYWCMENEGRDYFFGIPPVFVAKLTQENIERAFEALVADYNGRWIDIYGTLQEDITDTED